MIPTKQRIMESRTKILKKGLTPNTLILNPTDYNDSGFGQEIFGMKILEDNGVLEGECYILDTDKFTRLLSKIKKKTLWNKLVGRIIKYLFNIKEELK